MLNEIRTLTVGWYKLSNDCLNTQQTSAQIRYAWSMHILTPVSLTSIASLFVYSKLPGTLDDAVVNSLDIYLVTINKLLCANYGVLLVRIRNVQPSSPTSPFPALSFLPYGNLLNKWCITVLHRAHITRWL